MNTPHVPYPYGYRLAKVGETPEFFAYTTVVAQEHKSDCAVNVLRLMTDTARVHLPEDDHLLRDHLTSALNNDDLALGDYRALLFRALKRLHFLEWHKVTSADTEDFLKETEPADFEFANSSGLWEGYQNDPASWENATHYRPQNLPNQ